MRILGFPLFAIAMLIAYTIGYILSLINYSLYGGEWYVRQKNDLPTMRELLDEFKKTKNIGK